jgi:hypothetical protein
MREKSGEVKRIKRKLSGLVRSVAPLPVWNAYLRARGLGQVHSWRTFGYMATRADPRRLFEGRFAELYAKYSSLDPNLDPEKARYVHYCNCYFAALCRHVPGDFVCAGISYGVGAKMIFEFTDFPSLGKTLHLIDPFEGISVGGVAENYNRDPEYVRRQYPADAPIVIHRARIPLRLPGKLAFAISTTGVPVAEEASVPIFYEALSPGGILISDRGIHKLPSVTPLWLPSGLAVYFKQ